MTKEQLKSSIDSLITEREYMISRIKEIKWEIQQLNDSYYSQLPRMEALIEYIKDKHISIYEVYLHSDRDNSPTDYVLFSECDNEIRICPNEHFYTLIDIYNISEKEARSFFYKYIHIDNNYRNRASEYLWQQFYELACYEGNEDDGTYTYRWMNKIKPTDDEIVDYLVAEYYD